MEEESGEGMSTFFSCPSTVSLVNTRGENDWKELNSKSPLGTQELLTSKSQTAVCVTETEKGTSINNQPA